MEVWFRALGKVPEERDKLIIAVIGKRKIR